MIDAKRICAHDWQKDFWGQWTHQREKKYYGTMGYFTFHGIYWSRTKTTQNAKWFWLWNNKRSYGTEVTGDFQASEKK